MTWAQIIGLGSQGLLILWWMWHTRREFRRGYLLAIDHLEGMTRPGVLGSYSMPDAVAKLREDMRPKRKERA